MAEVSSQITVVPLVGSADRTAMGPAAIRLRCESRNRCWDVGPVSGGGSEGDGLSEFLQFVDELADAVFG